MANQTFVAQSCTLGTQQYSPKKVASVIGRENMTNMFAMGPLNAKNDPNGVWGYDRVNNAIVRMKTPGKATVGDIRVKYYIPSNRLEEGQADHVMAGMRDMRGSSQFTQDLHKDANITFRTFVSKYHK